MIFTAIKANLLKYVVIGFSVALLATAGWGYYNHLKKNEAISNKNLAQELLKNANRQIELLNGDLERLTAQDKINQDLLKENELKHQELEKKYDILRRRLRDTLNQDPDASDWANEPIPDSVRNILKGNSEGSNPTVPAREPSSRVPSSNAGTERRR
jgi:TolA-binding protein